MAKKKKSHGVPEAHAKYCEGCGKKIHQKARSCPHCGFTKSQIHSTNKTLAIVGLVLNIFIWPGLGTIVGGEVGKGMIQMILFLIGVPLIFVIIGIPMVILIWIWAIASSLNQIKRAE